MHFCFAAKYVGIMQNMRHLWSTVGGQKCVIKMMAQLIDSFFAS